MSFKFIRAAVSFLFSTSLLHAEPVCVSRQDLTAHAPGIVVSVHKLPGDKVAPGDLIVSLDDRLLSAGLKEGEAVVNVAKANEQIAKDAHDRLAKLSGSASVSEQQNVEVRLRLAQARAARAQAESALERLKIQISDTQIRAEIAGLVRGLPQVKGLFVQFGQSLGFIEAGPSGCPKS